MVRRSLHRDAWGVLVVVSVVGVAASARGDTDESSGAERATPRIEAVTFRTSVFDQTGRGGQSQADVRNARGSERALVFQPMGYVRIRQSASVVHEVVVPVDVVTSASTDALDAVASASRVNESISLDAATHISLSPVDTLSVRYGFHVEEPWRAGFAGATYARSLADDNAVLSLSVDGIYDSFAPHDHQGFYEDHVQRYTGSANASISQLLSPSTMVGASYGVTLQRGFLHTSWNSVETVAGERVDELFPDHRLRHAVSVFLAQAIPDTRTTFRLSYRYYTDTFDIRAHTAEMRLLQWMGRKALVRASYRFHRQSAPSFFMDRIRDDFAEGTYRTSDSDLAALDAHEVGLGFRWFFADAGAVTSASSYVDLGAYHYQRTNGLVVNLLTLGFGKVF